MQDKKIKKNAILLIVIVLYFICTYPFFTPDSVQYFSYIDFFEGLRPLSEWNPVRGWVFPFILWIGEWIAPNGLGTLVVFTLLYIVFLVYIYKIVILVSETMNYSIKQDLIKGLIGVLFCLNPIIYSVSHTILTEFTGAVFLVIQTYYATAFFEKRLREDVGRKDFSGYIVMSSILLILEYFLKQMFFPISVIIVIGYEILLLVKRHTFQMVFRSFLICFLMILSFGGSVAAFGKVTDQSKQTDTFAIILGGLRYFEIEGYEHKDGNTQMPLYIEGVHKVSVMNDEEKVIEEFDYEFDGTFNSSVKFLLKCMRTNSERFFKGYCDNYMLLCDLYERPAINDIIQYQTGPVIRGNMFKNLFNLNGTRNISQEFRNFFQMYLRERINTEQLMNTYSTLGWDFWNLRVLEYRDVSESLVGKVIGQEAVFNIYIIGYAFMLLISPVSAIYAFVKYCHRQNFYYAVQCILHLFTFSQIMLFTLSGCVVDRYMFVGYAAELMGLLLGIVFFPNIHNKAIIHLKKR